MYPQRLAVSYPPLSPAVRIVAERLREAGERVLLCGGSVRDHLLGRPVHDFDLATSAAPDRVTELFERTVLVGAQFGVARVLVGDEEVEVARFRADQEYLDGRHPKGVIFSSEVEDARRRDFTINGLFYDLDAGQVIDYVGGLADLAAGQLRAIGAPRDRFREDRLRMLRAVRFATVLGFEIEPATWEAIRAEASHVLEVSFERIRNELERILCHPRRELGYFLLSDSGLMAQILPEIESMRGVAQPPQYHPEGDVHRHTGLVLANLEAPSFPLALGALLHDVGKPGTFMVADRIRFPKHEQVGAEMTDAICERLHLSRRDHDEVVYLVRRHMVLPSVGEMRESTRKQLFMEPHFESLLALGLADCRASHGDTSAVEDARERFAEFRAAGPPPEPLIRGRDLIAAGMTPGPRMGEVLRAVEEAHLEGILVEPEAAIAWARVRFPDCFGVGG